ncbi:MAG: hypothetical protein V2I46_02890 [Bacteroides sp.]|jgi:hypothetical protein|nr:hypothetical protein [Bacteroides sp.]
MTLSKFDIEYNKWLRQLDVEEDDAVWNGIQDELDFIETWDHIAGQLDKIKPPKARVIPMKFLKYIAAAAAVILLMVLPVKNLVEQVIQPDIVAEQNNEGDQQIKIIRDEEPPLRKVETNTDLANGAETKVTPVDPSFQESFNFLSAAHLNGLVESKDFEETVFTSEKFVFEKIKIPSFDVDNLLASNVDMLQNWSGKHNARFSGPDDASGAAFRIVELGLVYGLKNTWLLNYETFNGLDPDRLGNTRFTFHHDIGASSMLEFNNQHLVGLEFFWKSEAGQNYQQYINASFVERNIQLDYRKVQAFYIYPQAKFPGQVLLGGYVARLTLAEEQQGIAVISVDNSYRKLDYGLVAGYQFNVSFRNNINIHPGFRVNYNLVNIFEGDDITPGRFKKTRNLSASFNISFSYRFPNE